MFYIESVLRSRSESWSSINSNGSHYWLLPFEGSGQWEAVSPLHILLPPKYHLTKLRIFSTGSDSRSLLRCHQYHGSANLPIEKPAMDLILKQFSKPTGQKRFELKNPLNREKLTVRPSYADSSSF
jgi:hypothetical protein